MNKQKFSAAALATLPPGDYTDHILARPQPDCRRPAQDLDAAPPRRRQAAPRHPRPLSGDGLADAREAARKLAERVETGAPIEPPPAHPRSAALSMGDSRQVRTISARQGRARHRNRLADAHAGMSARCLKDYLAMPAAAFGKNELRAARDAVAETAPVSSNRFMAYVSPILGWAAQEDLIPVDFSRVGHPGRRARPSASGS